SIISSLSLVLMLLAGAAPAALSAQESALKGKPFQLKAIMEDMPQLSRDGLDRGLTRDASRSKTGTAGDNPIAAVPLTGSVEELGEFQGGSSIPPSPRQEFQATPPANNGGGGQMPDAPNQQQ